MTNNFLKDYVKANSEVIQVAKEFELNVDFRDAKYLIDLCVIYSIWPISAYWKEIFERVIQLSGEDISNEKNLNKVKQWTNRYFDKALKDELIIKTHSNEDKRVVMFKWTEKGIKLMEMLNKK